MIVIKLLLSITVMTATLSAQPLRRFGEAEPNLSSPLSDAFVVRFDDVRTGEPPFRVTPKLGGWQGARVQFEVEIDRGLDKFLEVSLSSGRKNAPELITPLALSTDSSGITRVRFEVNPAFRGELWLIFSIEYKNRNEKSTLYLLDLKSWPIMARKENGEKTEITWPG